MRFDFPFASLTALLLPADLPLAARSALGPWALLRKAAPRGTRDNETMGQDEDSESVNAAAFEPLPSNSLLSFFPTFSRAHASHFPSSFGPYFLPSCGLYSGADLHQR